jgi:hypothetical protein
MKKLFAIAVIFALVAGTAFAMDVGGTVFGHVNFLEGSSAKDSEITANGNMDRLRIDGGGEAMEGKFGGYIRFHGDGGFSVNSAQAWWKPMDMIKFTIGQNINDGMWGKEGVTGWGFNQMPYDCGVAFNTGIWYGDGWGSAGIAPKDHSEGVYHTRWAFFGGWDGAGAALEIKPMDILSINFAIPFIADGGKTAGEIFSHVVGQVDVNIEGAGNIALTYKGEGRGYKDSGVAAPIKDNWGWDDADNNPATAPTWVNDPKPDSGKSKYNFDEPAGTFFLYYGNSFGPMGIDFGVGFHLPYHEDQTAGVDSKNRELGIGLGLKFATEQFGIKFRTAVAIPMEEWQNPIINADLLPYFIVNENIAVFLNTGLKVTLYSKTTTDLADKLGLTLNDPPVGFLINPYVRIGAEWGPTFYVGFQLWSQGDRYKDSDLSKKDMKDGVAVVDWAVPIALQVSF